MAARKVICDTDVLIDFLNRNEKRHQQTKKIILEEIGEQNVLLSAITIMELLKGATDKNEFNSIHKKIFHFGSIPIVESISNRALSLISKYSLTHGLSIPDSFLAATSLESGIEFFTYNNRDFRFIEGLKLYIP